MPKREQEARTNSMREIPIRPIIMNNRVRTKRLSARLNSTPREFVAFFSLSRSFVIILLSMQRKILKVLQTVTYLFLCTRIKCYRVIHSVLAIYVYLYLEMFFSNFFLLMLIVTPFHAIIFTLPVGKMMSAVF